MKTSIVLAHPEESRNIGSVCRAMANCDITDLRIVGKRAHYNEEQIRILAIHAIDIWQNATFFGSITDATKDCTIVAGTTRRRGKKRKGKLLLPEEFISTTLNTLGAQNDARIAVVFGAERTGLTDEELSECTIGVTIPSSKSFASLNLSHAVQIICYEIFRAETPNYTGFTPLTLSRIDETVSIITESLQKIGFFKIAGKNDMKNFWKGILSRAAISESEAKYIEKIFIKAACISSKKNYDKNSDENSAK